MYDLHTNKAVYEHIAPAVNKLKSKTKDLYKVFDFQVSTIDIFGKENIEHSVYKLNIQYTYFSSWLYSKDEIFLNIFSIKLESIRLKFEL